MNKFAFYKNQNQNTCRANASGKCMWNDVFYVILNNPYINYFQTYGVAQKRKAAGGDRDDGENGEDEPAPTVAYDGDHCADNLDLGWEDDDNDGDNDDDVGAVGDVPQRPTTKAKKGDTKSKKKGKKTCDERATVLDQMASSVTAMAGAYAKAKDGESRVASWAKLSGEKLEALPVYVQEDLMNDFDNAIHRAVREQRRANEK